MDDRDRRELQALRDQFKELMQRDVELTVFDEDTCQRIGEMIARSARPGEAENSSRRR
jgi:hypothetical protein